jgi:hypothetical protein
MCFETPCRQSAYLPKLVHVVKEGLGQPWSIIREDAEEGRLVVVIAGKIATPKPEAGAHRELF